MRRSASFALAFALAAGAAGRGPALADDPPAGAPPAGAKPDGTRPDGAKPDGANPDGAAQDPAKRPAGAEGAPKDTSGKADPAGPTRIERAKKIVRELETTLTILRAAKTVDAETILALERALAEAKKLVQPVTLQELTEEERKAIGDEVREELAEERESPAGPATAGPGEDWRQRAIASAFKDAGLSEEEQIEATKIVQDWFRRSEEARHARDSKAMSDVKGERDRMLEKLLGRKKAQKVINNLNGLSGWRR